MRKAPELSEGGSGPTFYMAGAEGLANLEWTTGRCVLESFAYADRHISDSFEAFRGTWKGAMLDSGAFSVQNAGAAVDMGAYRAFIEEKGSFYDSIAGLDVISDWRKSVENWRAMEDLGVFPTFHEGEPFELLLDYAREQGARGGWVGLGAQRPIVPARLATWLMACKDILGDMASSVHFHGFAMTMYSTVFPFSSTDSAAWMHRMKNLQAVTELNHLTRPEMLSIALSRLERAHMRTSWDPNWVAVLSKTDAKRSLAQDLGVSTLDIFTTQVEVER
jgi:hypothetical protein